MQLLSVDANILSKNFKIFFAHKKLKKPPSKVAQKTSNPLFFPLRKYCPELPKWPKQKNLCSQLYIELGVSQPKPQPNKPISSVFISNHIYWLPCSNFEQEAVHKGRHHFFPVFPSPMSSTGPS